MTAIDKIKLPLESKGKRRIRLYCISGLGGSEWKRVGVERKPQGKINSCMHFQQKNN
jgi:hypothetical protein